MRMNALLGAAVAVVAAAGGARADNPPAGPPAPAPEMASIQFLAGTAHCTGMQNASDFGPAHATKATLKGKMDLSGFWLSFRYNERKTKANPLPIHVLALFGYDSAAKQLVSVGFDNFGGKGSETSPGLDKNQIVFTGDFDVAGMKLAFRETYTKGDGGSVTHLSEYQGKDGKWATLDQETCTAAPAKAAKAH